MSHGSRSSRTIADLTDIALEFCSRGFATIVACCFVAFNRPSFLSAALLIGPSAAIDVYRNLWRPEFRVFLPRSTKPTSMSSQATQNELVLSRLLNPVPLVLSGAITLVVLGSVLPRSLVSSTIDILPSFLPNFVIALGHNLAGGASIATQFSALVGARSATAVEVLLGLFFIASYSLFLVSLGKPTFVGAIKWAKMLKDPRDPLRQRGFRPTSIWKHMLVWAFMSGAALWAIKQTVVGAMRKPLSMHIGIVHSDIGMLKVGILELAWPIFTMLCYIYILGWRELRLQKQSLRSL